MAKPQPRSIEVSESGRMSLPADIRNALGLHGAGRVILTQDDSGVRITTADHVLDRVRALAAPFKPEGRSVVDDLLAERRVDALRDEAGPEPGNA